MKKITFRRKSIIFKINRYLTIRYLVVIVLGWIALYVALFIIFEPRYEATVILIVEQDETRDVVEGYYSDYYIIQTYEYLTTSSPLLKNIIEKENIPYTEQQLKRRISSSHNEMNTLLSIQVEASSKEEALLILNAVVLELELAQSHIESLSPLLPIDTMYISHEPSSITRQIAYISIGLVWSFIAILITNSYYKLQKKIVLPRHIMDMLDIPLLGVIPEYIVEEKTPQSK